MKIDGKRTFQFTVEAEQVELFSLWRAIDGWHLPELRLKIEDMVGPEVVKAWKGESRKDA
jgi:hypothetical protein